MTLQLTPTACEHLRAQRAREDLALWVEVTGHHGNQFIYDLHFDPAPETAHERLELEDLVVVVPEDSVASLEGATLDMHPVQGLSIRNPNRPQPDPVPGLVRDDALSDQVQALIDDAIAPALAADGGYVTYLGHNNGVVHLVMGGGCQGCAVATTSTMEGLRRILMSRVTGVVDVLDDTDHAAGMNPFYP